MGNRRRVAKKQRGASPILRSPHTNRQTERRLVRTPKYFLLPSLKHGRAELTEEQSEQLLCTLIVGLHKFQIGVISLTCLEPSHVATYVFCCHAQGKLDFGAILHQTHLCLDPVHSESSCLICCEATGIGRCIRQPPFNMGFIASIVRRPAPSAPRLRYELGRRGQEAL
jgi:hypothetical protein